ncbi:MAG: hypothetical protein ABIB79_02980 [archaeon]
MAYERAGLFHLIDFDPNRVWAVALGKKRGSYPGERFDSDLLAVDFKNAPLEEELIKRIKRSEYFENTLVIGRSNGIVSVSKRRFGEKMREELGPEASQFIVQTPRYNKKYVSLSLNPICKEAATYEPEFVDFLANSIENVLRRTPP